MKTMKRLILIISLWILCTLLFAQENVIKENIKDADTQEPMIGAICYLSIVFDQSIR
jgi:hypothetical protein